VYPFIDGVTGHDVVLTVQQWRELGRATKAVHSTDARDLAGGIAHETFTAVNRDFVSDLLLRPDDVTTHDGMIADAIALLRARRGEIRALIDRTELLARMLHNLLIGRDGALYIVDWDYPTYAPKERDLMFPGGTRSFVGYTPEQEERFFLRGYGETPPIDRTALAYYRCERTIRDFADAYHEISSPW
jgi:spectinomycin phosphotransferase